MQIKRILLLTFTLTVLTLFNLKAQDVIPASGAVGSGSGGSISYSVGQVFFSNITENSGSVLQGVQQPYEISFAIGILPQKGITLKCSVYPNPTVDFLILKVEDYDLEKLSYQLYNLNGQLLEFKNLKSSETYIDMRQRVPEVYFLKVIQIRNSESPNSLVEYKIIKK